jgi:phytoene dehydrogenase-like protein
MAALRLALRAAGGRLIEGCAVEALEREGGRVVGLRTGAGAVRAATTITLGRHVDLLGPDDVVDAAAARRDGERHRLALERADR